MPKNPDFFFLLNRWFSVWEVVGKLKTPDGSWTHDAVE